jgi:hypothetical protein
LEGCAKIVSHQHQTRTVADQDLRSRVQGDAFQKQRCSRPCDLIDFGDAEPMKAIHRLALLAFALLMLSLTPSVAMAEDRDTYREIVERMHDGEGYYPAAAVELREGNFPLKPGLAFRPPTLAWLLSWLPDTTARFAVLVGLVIAAVLAWARSFSDETSAYRLSLVAFLMCGLANVGGPASVYLHEAWAIVMMTFSLAFYRRLALSAIFALFAVLIRETALAFVAATAVVALVQADYRRVSVMVGIVIVSVVLWFYHAHLASMQTNPSDLSSPGWLYFQGPSMILATSKWNLLTAALPDPFLIALLVVMGCGLALVRRDELQVAAVTVALFCIALLALGRPNNNYWGIMFAPFLGLGLPELVRRTRRQIALAREAAI